MDELLTQFLIEAPELIERAGEDLLGLERAPDDRALIDSAFRAIHTLKGSVQLFDYAPMADVLHAAEDVLGLVRAGEGAVSTDLVDALLATMDKAGEWLGDIERSGELAQGATAAAAGLILKLRQVEAEAPIEVGEGWAATLERPASATGAITAVRYAPHAQAYFRGDDPLAIARAVPGLVSLAARTTTSASAEYDPFVCALEFELVSVADRDAVAASLRLVADQVEIVVLPPAGRDPETPAVTTAPTATSSLLRIDSRRVDALADMTDELIVARNALLSLEDPDPALRSVQDMLGGLVSALHRNVMGLRMTPLAPTLRRLDRQARDLSIQLGRAAVVEVRGHAVEADRAIVDGLYEPLVHLVRNALDHGLEDSPARATAGKTEPARVSVLARVEGDAVVVEVADNGRGLDPVRLRSTAAQRGLMDEARLAALSDEEALNLVFRAGFSTADNVSAVSGRGVGMDAVRSAVNALGGRVSLASVPGEGTTVAVRLPLTVVMTRILVVEAGGERYGVPLDAVQETLTLTSGEIFPVRQGRAVVIRDRTLPLLSLAEVVGGADAAPQGRVTALIVEDVAPFALAVDRLGERLDVVLRPLTGLLATLPGALGTTLLGDGSLLVVLDVREMAR